MQYRINAADASAIELQEDPLLSLVIVWAKPLA